MNRVWFFLLSFLLIGNAYPCDDRYIDLHDAIQDLTPSSSGRTFRLQRLWLDARDADLAHQTKLQYSCIVLGGVTSFIALWLLRNRDSIFPYSLKDIITYATSVICLYLGKSSFEYAWYLIKNKRQIANQRIKNCMIASFGIGGSAAIEEIYFKADL